MVRLLTIQRFMAFWKLLGRITQHPINTGVSYLVNKILSAFISMDDSETEREEQPLASAKKKCLFDDSIVGKVSKLLMEPQLIIIIGNRNLYAFFLLHQLVVVQSGSKRRSMWFPALVSLCKVSLENKCTKFNLFDNQGERYT